MHTEVLSFIATAPGAAPGLAATALTGDSLVIKNNQGAIRPTVLAAWGFQQADGFQQVTFPSGHDTTRGYRYAVSIENTSARLPEGAFMAMTAQEQLSITVVGSANAGDQELGCLLVHYPMLPGVQSRAITYTEYLNRLEKLTTIQATVGGVTGGIYQEELINAESDLLMANRDYAIIGMEAAVPCLAVTLRGTDLGNVRVACPGGNNVDGYQSNFFASLAQTFGMPLIPVINSGNRNNTFLGVVQNEAGAATGAVPITLYLALLA
jgi:hypothetical protein